MFINIVVCVFLLSEACLAQHTKKPHLIFIVADDLGWNDVGFHGSNQIPTPNIDALAYSGVILNNYYVSPICTPSRSSLMTGKYPERLGMQHRVLYGAEARGLPLAEKLLPQYLQGHGYKNHIVGKWHLGSWKKEYTPLYRGFLSHTGFWTGHQDYFDHTAVEAPGWGLDMRRNMSVAYDLHGQYSTDVFTEESKRIIEQHDKTNPLFLYLAHAAVHSGNPYNPLPAPDDVVSEFEYIKDYKRRRFAAMLKKLDDSVGEVVKALKANHMLEDSIIVFTSDNGGPAAGFNLNAASNFPLKGVKHTLWEGGVRGAGFVWSTMIQKPFRVSNQMMHISDWLPTLISAISGNTSALVNIDGIDVWKSVSEDAVSPRTEILHNIDDIFGIAAMRSGAWKILKGATYGGTWDNWYGPSGKGYEYNFTAVTDSPAGVSLKSLGRLASLTKMQKSRKNAEVECVNVNGTKCYPMKETCLFNILDDPCERNNVAALYPKILEELEAILEKLNATVAVPPANLPLDPRGNPKYWSYTFTNFGDYV